MVKFTTLQRRFSQGRINKISVCVTAVIEAPPLSLVTLWFYRCCYTDYFSIHVQIVLFSEGGRGVHIYIFSSIFSLFTKLDHRSNWLYLPSELLCFDCPHSEHSLRVLWMPSSIDWIRQRTYVRKGKEKKNWMQSYSHYQQAGWERLTLALYSIAFAYSTLITVHFTHSVLSLSCSPHYCPPAAFLPSSFELNPG